jgi:hypothetical protein
LVPTFVPTVPADGIGIRIGPRFGAGTADAFVAFVAATHVDGTPTHSSDTRT